MTTLEKQVKKNGLALEKEMNSLIKSHKDKYAVFHNGKKYFTNTFEKAVNTGIEKFGEDTGFAVHKITKSKPILSALVKL